MTDLVWDLTEALIVVACFRTFLVLLIGFDPFMINVNCSRKDDAR